MTDGETNMTETTSGGTEKVPQTETQTQTETRAQAQTDTETQRQEPTNGAVPALEVRSISKYFGSVNALEDVSLAVYSGQVTCVLGDNGAGKSTLIKILSGVHSPDHGEVLFEGDPVSFAGP